MKKKIRMPNGNEVEASVVDITSAQENWNQYLLADGTVLKLKAVATEVVRLEGQHDGEGNPVYMVKSTNVVATSVPEDLKGRASG
jgi:hypothetical protein